MSRRDLTRRLVRAGVWVLLRVLPARRHAVVRGWPDSEGNAVEAVRGLARRYRGEIHWLLDDVDYPGPDFARAELADPRVGRVRARSPRAVWLALTAELTLFTHGLWTAVPPPEDRLVVNLWHGDGPKRLPDAAAIRSSVLVSGSQLWSRYTRKVFALADDRVAVVGYPRIDQLVEPVPAATVAGLDLPADRPLVLWLPTFRHARGPGGVAYTDAERLTGRADVQAVAVALADAASAHGVEVVVKPHPLDIDTYAGLGLRVLPQAALDRAGVSLYQLLGRCAGLITDTSSVWVDYLALDRPVAFCLPDLDELHRGRGLHVADLAPLLPGPRLARPADAAGWLAAVAAGDPDARPSRSSAATALGPVPGPGATDRLLDWLDGFQRGRGRPVLFSGA